MFMSSRTSIENILGDFGKISLAEIQKASLLRRRDSKFIFSADKVQAILSDLESEYRVLEIESKYIHSYQTTYYDTDDLKMYHKHHRGMVNRHKIRFRKYNTSDIVFLEVKLKDSRGVTTKNRMKAENGKNVILSKEEEFLNSYTPFKNAEINPVLENSFNRITLVHHGQKERITLDYKLEFSKPGRKDLLEIPGIAIAEIKYEDKLADSPFVKCLRKNHIHPRRFSKYCTGMAMLNPDLKQNLFKMRVREVNKINNIYKEKFK